MHTPFFHLCSSAQCVQSQGLPKFNLHLWKKFPLLVLNASPFNFMEDAQVLVLWDSPGVADLPPVGYSLSYMLLLCLLLFIAYLRFKKSLSISCHVRDFSISLIILDGLLWITSNYAILFLKSGGHTIHCGWECLIYMCYTQFFHIIQHPICSSDCDTSALHFPALYLGNSLP